jgi:hypothetical protein
VEQHAVGQHGRRKRFANFRHLAAARHSAMATLSEMTDEQGEVGVALKLYGACRHTSVAWPTQTIAESGTASRSTACCRER